MTDPTWPAALVVVAILAYRVARAYLDGKAEITLLRAEISELRGKADRPLAEIEARLKHVEEALRTQAIQRLRRSTTPTVFPGTPPSKRGV